MFNLKKTAIYQAIKWEKIFWLRFLRIIKRIFVIIFILALFWLIAEYIQALVNIEALPKSLNRSAWAILFLALSPALAISTIIAFFNSKLKNPRVRPTLEQALANPEKYNLAEFLSYSSAKTINSARKISYKLRTEPNSDILLYSALKNNPRLNFVFSRALINVKGLEHELEEKFRRKNFGAPDFDRIILEAGKLAVSRKHKRIEIGDLIITLAQHNDFFAEVLIEVDLEPQDIKALVFWMERLEKNWAKRKRFWDYDNLMRMGTLAKEWTAGYTITLDKYSIDINSQVEQTLPEIIGHKKELETVQRVLSRQEINNALLVGEPGTGRRSIVQGIAVKSVLGQGNTAINYKRIVQLDLASLLSRIQNQEEVERTLDGIFSETVSAGNIILVIDEFHNYIGKRETLGIVDISGILGSYLNNPHFQIIAITTYAGLHQQIEQNPSILNLFEKIGVSEINAEQTMMLLQKYSFVLEKINNQLISYPALKAIIKLSDKYLANLYFPKKATDLLDQVSAYAAKNKQEVIVLPQHVAQVVTRKTEIPVGEIEGTEKEKLLHLEELIHQRIINQEEAVEEISEALRRARAGVTKRTAPMGSFLFLGPTGVGKTETAKALAEIYFGSEKRMIRQDMSEFQLVKDIGRLIGARSEQGMLTTKVRENPFSLVLLDEIEKAHPNILNLFLQVLDEGNLTDGQGRKISFLNNIIIATSNAGYKLILEALKKNEDWQGLKEKVLDYLFKKALFRPEFINRFDAVVLFRPLTKQNLLDISQLLLQKLQKNLSEKHIDFVITGPLKEKIVELGYSPTFGARQVRRIIQNRIENPLAHALLAEQIKKGDKVTVDANTFKVKKKG